MWPAVPPFNCLPEQLTRFLFRGFGYPARDAEAKDADREREHEQGAEHDRVDEDG